MSDEDAAARIDISLEKSLDILASFSLINDDQDRANVCSRIQRRKCQMITFFSNSFFSSLYAISVSPSSHFHLHSLFLSLFIVKEEGEASRESDDDDDGAVNYSCPIAEARKHRGREDGRKSVCV